MLPVSQDRHSIFSFQLITVRNNRIDYYLTVTVIGTVNSWHTQTPELRSTGLQVGYSRSAVRQASNITHDIQPVQGPAYPTVNTVGFDRPQRQTRLQARRPARSTVSSSLFSAYVASRCVTTVHFDNKDSSRPNTSGHYITTSRRSVSCIVAS